MGRPRPRLTRALSVLPALADRAREAMYPPENGSKTAARNGEAGVNTSSRGDVMTQDQSRVREYRTPGSVQGEGG